MDVFMDTTPTPSQVNDQSEQKDDNKDKQDDQNDDGRKKASSKPISLFLLIISERPNDTNDPDPPSK